MSDDKSQQEKKLGIPRALGQVAGGLTGFYLGHQAADQFVDHGLRKMDIPPEVVDAMQPVLEIGLGLATGFAGVMMAKKDSNHAFFFGARTVAAMGGAAVALKVADEIGEIRKELKDLKEHADAGKQPGTHEVNLTAAPVPELDRALTVPVSGAATDDFTWHGSGGESDLGSAFIHAGTAPVDDYLTPSDGPASADYAGGFDSPSLDSV